MWTLNRVIVLNKTQRGSWLIFIKNEISELKEDGESYVIQNYTLITAGGV